MSDGHWPTCGACGCGINDDGFCGCMPSSVPPHAAGEEDKPIADRLYEAIERVLTDHRLQHWYTADDAGENFRLLDHLSSGETIESGRDEIRLICDSIYNDVLLKEFPAASQAAPETMPDHIQRTLEAKRAIRRRLPNANESIEDEMIFWLADRVAELENDLWCARHALVVAVEERNTIQASTAQETKRARILDTYRHTVEGLLGHDKYCSRSKAALRPCDCTRAGLLSELYPVLSRPVEGAIDG